MWMYNGIAEQIWRTKSFSFAMDVAFQYSIGYEVHAYPINGNSPGSITAARFAISALSDLLLSTRNIPDPASWDVYDQLLEATDQQPPKPWFRFVPNAIAGAALIPAENLAADQVGNTEVTIRQKNPGDIPDPGLPLPNLFVMITNLQPDQPVDARVTALLLSLALTKLPWMHAPDQKITAGGFGPGQRFFEFPKTHGASILIESLADYAGTPDEITFLHISYALRQLALHAANKNYYGGFSSEWRLKDYPAFMRISIVRAQGDGSQTQNSTVDQGQPTDFDQFVSQPFVAVDSGTAATISTS